MSVLKEYLGEVYFFLHTLPQDSQSCRSNLTHTRHPSALTNTGIAQLLVPMAEPPHPTPSCFCLQQNARRNRAASMAIWRWKSQRAQRVSLCFALSQHTGSTYPPLPTSVPACWGSSLATVASRCFASVPYSFSFLPPFQQFRAGCSSPVLAR